MHSRHSHRAICPGSSNFGGDFQYESDLRSKESEASIILILIAYAPGLSGLGFSHVSPAQYFFLATGSPQLLGEFKQGRI
eukprot:SAG31_NODE_5162_length_2706_cov_2.025316_2_plen_80_part_00